MVRKRSRTSRKYNDDDNDTDSDYELEETQSAPPEKKYSLRQRKRRIFTEFEFDDDGDEIEPTGVPSDDEDFEVEREVEQALENEHNDRTTYANHYESGIDMPEDADADGLIDFEDMIRADIVVNRNRIDYDNIIQKTEIKVQPIEEIVKPIVKSKRGRKPKVRPVEEIDSSLLEPETEMHEEDFEDKADKDYDPADDLDDEEPIDCAQLMKAELNESDQVHTESNGAPNNEINDIPDPENHSEQDNQTEETQDEEKSNIPSATSPTDDSKVDVDNSSQINSEISEVTPVVPSPKHQDVITPDKISVEPKKGTEDDDDDVVLVEDEKKCEVIVLDD